MSDGSGAASPKERNDAACAFSGVVHSSCVGGSVRRSGPRCCIRNGRRLESGKLGILRQLNSAEHPIGSEEGFRSGLQAEAAPPWPSGARGQMVREPARGHCVCGGGGR